MDLIKLKQEVIEAFIAHETGGELKYKNSEYDKMLSEVQDQDPDFNPFDYLPTDEVKLEHRKGLIWLEKYSPANNDIRQYWNKESGKVKYPKYDGSSLVVYYSNGKLQRILSMGDKDTGTDQTEKFRSFVPDIVDPSISYFRCECLIDCRLYENARGKANGLVNSKYLQSEIDEMATLVGYQVTDLNYNLVPRSEWSINPIFNGSGRLLFMMSPECHEIELCEERGYAHYKSGNIDFKFCIDGIVYAEDDAWTAQWAYKYDYLNTAETTVNYIDWRETDKEGFTPVLEVEPVMLEGKWIQNPSANGTPKLLELNCGVGATVEVAFSGMTIPKVIKVVKESDVELPKCPYCGTQLNEDDIYGSLLKCSNKDCHRKYDLRRSWININNCKSLDYLYEWIEYYLMDSLNIARFNYESKRVVDIDSIKSEMIELIKSKSYDELANKIWNWYHMSDLQWSEMVLNLKSTVDVINEVINEFNNLENA
jgi:DNA ligase (NAD+)